jgi:hypothetical protein
LKKRKRYVGYAFISLIIIFLLNCQISAHEVFANTNGQAAELRWTHFYSSSLLLLKTSDDYLNGPLADNYSPMRVCWNGSYSPVLTQDVPFANSTVDYCTPTTTWWDNNNYGSIWAMTYLYDTNNDLVMSYNQALASTGSIHYAAIYVNPYPARLPSSSTTQTKILVHEAGHALCLGHPDRIYYQYLDPSIPSVMRQGALGFCDPQDHEETDLENMYFD